MGLLQDMTVGDSHEMSGMVVKEWHFQAGHMSDWAPIEDFFWDLTLH